MRTRTLAQADSEEQEKTQWEKTLGTFDFVEPLWTENHFGQNSLRFIDCL
jgi:hypothetical protein